MPNYMFKDRAREEFIEYMEARGLLPASIKKYTYLFHSYIKRFGNKIGQKRIDRFLIRNRFSTPSRAFLTNFKAYLIRQDPSNNDLRFLEITKRRGSKKARIRKYIRRKDVLKIERYMEDERDRLMLLISFYTGIRLTGLMNLSWNSFNWDLWKEDKSRAVTFNVVEKRDKEREVYLTPKVAVRLRKWVKRTKPSYRKGKRASYPLWEIGARRWQQILKKASEDAGLKYVHPHTLRHSFATWSLRSNRVSLEQLRDIMGHESVSTTEIYAKLDRSKLKGSYESLFAKND